MEKIKIQTFLNDSCTIYRADDPGKPETLFSGIPLEYRTVGSSRSFDAMQNGHRISKMIRIPDVGTDLNGCSVNIRGSHFQIVTAQWIYDTSPKCIQLTLEKLNICWAAERGE